MEKELTLKVGEKKAREIYAKADSTMKQILEASAPKGFFSDNILDRISSIEDAFDHAGVSLQDPEVVPYQNPKNPDQVAVNAFAKLIVGIRVLNEGVVLDFSNSNQVKYRPYLAYKPGFGLSYGDYGYTNSDASVGSRLSFAKSQAAMHAPVVYNKEYNEMML